jgi:outer membrane protein assembly factor BamB
MMVLIIVGGCLGTTGAVRRGWAGVSQADGTLIFASMTGHVHTVDAASGAVGGSSIQLVQTVSGGLLGCSTSTSGIPMYGAPGVDGGLVFLGGYDGKVYAYPIVGGVLGSQPKWIYPRQGALRGHIVGGVTVSEGNIYFATDDGSVYSITAADGYEVWQQPHRIGHKIWSTAAVANGLVYIGSFDKTVYALDAATGAEVWKYTTLGAISAAPLAFGGNVYVGSYDRHFYALDGRTGALLWRYPQDGGPGAPRNWFWAQAVASGNTIYAPSLDGNVYILDARSGSLIKVVSVGSSISAAPALAGDAVIVAATDLYKKTSVIYAISTADNSARQLTTLNEGVDAALYASNGVAYIHTTADNFYGLTVQIGAVQKVTLNK